MDAIVSKSEFARLAGVSKAAVSDALRRGKLVQNPDGKIDMGAKVNAEYMLHRKDISSGAVSNPDRSREQYAKPIPFHPPASGDEVSRYSLELRKLEAQATKIELENAEKIGTVADRSFVMAGFFRPCETLFTQLLSDFVKSCAGTIIPMVQSDAPRLEVEARINQIVSNFLKPCRSRMEEAVKALCGGDEAARQ